MQKFYHKIIEDALQRFDHADSALPGHNGPYHQQETCIRNTSHWLVTFSAMYQWTKQQEYAEVISRFAKTVCDAVEESENGAICCIPHNRTSTNGLIGLAWAIEGLVAAYAVVKEPRYLDAAKRMFFSQTYNYSLHTWEVINTVGEPLGVDIAFNHSVWFCMAAAKLLVEDTNAQIESQLQDYLQHIDEQFVIYHTGLISHYVIKTGNHFSDLKRRFRKRICAITGKGIPWKNWNMVEYERAYHLYSLYALAIIYRLYPKLCFFQGSKFQKIKDYGLKIDHFIHFPHMNAFAYGYNSPAFELPLVEYVFGNHNDKEYEDRLLMLQERYYQVGDRYNSENIPDVETFSARIYEAIQYHQMKGDKLV